MLRWGSKTTYITRNFFWLPCIQEQQNQNYDLFIERIRKYTEADELTPYEAHDLIKAIYVGAPDTSSG